MQDRNCSVPDCRRPVVCRGCCKAHYHRLRQYGDVRADIPIKEMPTRAERDDVVARILNRCEAKPDGCIEWTGPTNLHGYARIRWQGRDWQAHRAIWTQLNGPIPDDDDWTVDHLCRNRACQNVKHMEVVTRLENSIRGGGLAIAQANNAARSHCPNGHRYTPDTIYMSAKGQRMCKVCKRAAWMKRRQVMSEERRRDYRARRNAGATPYQALHVRWWEYPADRPA